MVNGTIKKKMNLKSVLIFSANLSETFLILTELTEIEDKNYASYNCSIRNN